MNRIVLAAALVAVPALPCSAQVTGNLGSTRAVAAPNGLASQVTVGTTAALVAPARDTRQELLLSFGPASNCAVGFGPGVTLATGYRLLQAGVVTPVRSRSAVYVVCDADATISVLDAF